MRTAPLNIPRNQNKKKNLFIYFIFNFGKRISFFLKSASPYKLNVNEKLKIITPFSCPLISLYFAPFFAFGFLSLFPFLYVSFSMVMEDNESCGSKASDTSSPVQSRQQRQKLKVYNEVLRRLRESDKEEANRPGFDDELWTHFHRLPTRYIFYNFFSSELTACITFSFIFILHLYLL